MRDLETIEDRVIEGQNVTTQSYEAMSKKRRANHNDKMRSKTYYIFGGFLLLSGFGYYLSKYFLRIRPVANSVFFCKTLELLKIEPLVQKEIGLPIGFLQNIRGNINYNYSKAQTHMTIYGPNGFGKVYSEGHFSKSDKKWVVSKISLKIKEKEHSLV